MPPLADAKQDLPLRGLRIADFGVYVAMPFGSLVLASMGAEVICLESRRAIGLRAWPPFADEVHGVNRGGGYNLLNRGKLSCTLNLGTPEGRSLAEELISISDVVVENFSPGTMDKLGLGYRRLAEVKPDIIMLSLSGFGRTGPMRNYVGFHSAVLLFSGMAAITGYRGSNSRIFGSVFPDPVSGTYAVLALLQALYYRRKTGQGQHIDVAMYEALMSLMPQAIIEYTLNGRQPPRQGNEDPVKAPHGVYPCRHEDSWVAISVSSQAEWQALCEATGHPEWYADPRFADAESRRANAQKLDALIAGWTGHLTPYKVTHILQNAGVAAGPSLDARGILEEPHLQQRGFVLQVDHPEAGRRPSVGLPWQVSDLPGPDSRPAPLLGQHTGQVLGGLLGLTGMEIERLTEERVAY